MINLNRFEIKFVDNYSNIKNILKILKDKNFNICFPNRKISSIYFENSDQKIYLETEEGITPRKKIRIRYYNNNLKKINLELKETVSYNRKKSVSNLSSFHFKKIEKFGYWDKKYGLCLPKIIVEYERIYLINNLNNLRVTVDFNLSFGLHGGIFKKKIHDLIIELKTSKLQNVSYLDDVLSSKRRRYSKYLRGFDEVVI